MNVLAIIVAAGQGVRMGADRPKGVVRLGGLTLLERSLAAFLSHPRVDRVVAAVLDPGEAGRILGPSAERVVLVRGGATRQDSVRCALLAAPSSGDEIILVHDAARPLVTRAIIDRSEEHTSELQSRLHLVCRLLLEKKKTNRLPCTHLRTT